MQGQEWWETFWSERRPDPGKAATEGDTWQDLVWQVALERWHALFSERALGRRMLECGCGSAKLSRYMAARGYDCTLLDYSTQGIRLAMGGFGEESLAGAFVIGDLHHLPFPDNSFDIVYCGGVLEFFPNIRPPIGEMVRVLRPGGIFSANVVPRKFSVQTLADIERTLAHSCRNLARGRLRDAFRRVQAIPAGYDLNSAGLSDYVEACEAAGATQVVGLVTCPFPALALPAFGARLYARTMRAWLPVWRRFDASRARWTDLWGTTYTVYGAKAPRAR